MFFKSLSCICLCCLVQLRTKGKFEKRQQAAGINFEPEGLLYDESLQDSILQPTKQFLHDWMHMMVVSGVVQTTLYLFFEAMNSAGIDFYSMVHGYMALWVLPFVGSVKLQDIFGPKRKKANKDAKTYKCTASECLAFMPILAYFVQVVVVKNGKCLEACNALLAVVDLLELLQSVPHGRVTPTLLRKAVLAVQAAFGKCNWQAWCHPKFHWMVHLPRHLERFGCLPSCWVHERKHRITKRFASDIRKTTIFERSILVQVIGHNLNLLLDDEYFSMEAKLKKKCKASRKVLDFFQAVWHEAIQSCFMCVAAHLNPAGTAHKNDVVLLKSGHQVCQIWLFAEVNNENVALVSLWTLLEKHASHNIWQPANQPHLVHTSDMACPLTHRYLEDNKVVILTPMQHRI